MGLPQNIKKSIDILTEDPKVKAACEIEAYVNGLRDKKDELYKTRDSLPSLSNMAREFVENVWIPHWRKSPYLDLNTAETHWKKKFLCLHSLYSKFRCDCPLPSTYTVKLYNGPSLKDRKGGKNLEFGIYVSSPEFKIPKKLGKQLRFASRCKNPEKKARLVDQADEALVKELKIPGVFLAPTWYVNTMKCSVDVRLQWFVTPYTKEMDEVSRKRDDIEAKLKEVEAKEDEFRKILPTPVIEILQMMGRGPGIMPFHPLMGLRGRVSTSHRLFGRW